MTDPYSEMTTICHLLYQHEHTHIHIDANTIKLCLQCLCAYMRTLHILAYIALKITLQLSTDIISILQWGTEK